MIYALARQVFDLVFGRKSSPQMNQGDGHTVGIVGLLVGIFKMHMLLYTDRFVGKLTPFACLSFNVWFCVV